MKRRQFLGGAAKSLLLFTYPALIMSNNRSENNSPLQSIKLFLCGDVMTGRGIDQILPHPDDPHLYESYVDDAREYVELAEQVNGRIPKPVGFDYIWGDALAELEQAAPDVRVINLETSITKSRHAWPKGINYRMNPANIPCLTVAHIDCCLLANNHVLDWGYEGLTETLETLHTVNIKTAGAGPDAKAASAPAILPIQDKGRVLVFSYGLESSGVPPDWGAGARRAGVNYLPGLSHKSIEHISQQVQAVKKRWDIVVVSVHWGSNWGYVIPDSHVQFAHALIDVAGVDIIHGHSSHHPRGIEIYKGKPVFYGCGDFLNDYEGISGYEEYRDDLAFMYFVSIPPDGGKLAGLELVPMQTKRFRSQRASAHDAMWLLDTLNRVSKIFDTVFRMNEHGNLVLQQAP
jgi:poly-gamma-glutamate capsule biosynthesis protein CapA/YwtB (metallophosphatase superfamily)